MNLIRLVFVLILISLGVLFWMFWQGANEDLYEDSVRFDNALVEILVDNGISDADLLSQLRQEKKSGISMWALYYKEILLSDKIDLINLISQIQVLAGEYNLIFSQTRTGKDSLAVEIGSGNKIFSKLVFITSKRTKKKTCRCC